MIDAYGLEITVSNSSLITIVNNATDLLFRKKDGIADLLSQESYPSGDCPILSIYTALMYFFSFSQRLITDCFPGLIEKIVQSPLNPRESQYLSAIKKT